VSRLGIISGMVSELRCLKAAIADLPAPHPFTAALGGRADAVREAARDMIDAGATALLSFGCAGALSADLAPGDIVLADSVVAPTGERYATDPQWRGRIDAATRQVFAGATLPMVGAIAGSDRPVLSPRAKMLLSATSSAVAVDMESHAVAQVASAANLPFLALRAIVDPTDRTVPEAAFRAMGPRGRITPWPLLAGLMERPMLIRDLVRLAHDARAARSGLRRAAGLGAALLRVG
jgi:adenosylhomocysteine nucleosidase